MKNLKKLFVVLPLVLVMLLSVVPVLAEDTTVDTDYVADPAFKVVVDQTKFTKEDYVKYLGTEGTLIPVWVGENKPFEKSNVKNVRDLNERHLNVVLMNGGAVHGWITVNYDAVGPLASAQTYVAENLPEYNIPSYQIQNVMKFVKTVKVPEDKLENAPTTSREVITGREWVVDPATAVYDANVTLLGIKKGDVLDEATFKTVAWTKDENARTATGTVSFPGKTTTIVPVTANLKEEIKTVVETGISAADPNKLVSAKIEGLLIVVEASNMPVSVTHHFVFEDGTEIVQTADQKWAKANGALTIATVNPAWYMTVPGFTIDTTKTNVEEVRDTENYLVLGEKVLKGYKVDLYYTAGEGADKDQVDAALAGNTANVANAQQLPATGAVDSFALVLSSLALVVVGLFFKK